MKGNRYSGCRNLCRVIGPFDGVTIEGNRARGGRSAIVVLPGTDIAAANGAEADSLYRRLTIKGNDLLDTTTDDANAILIALSNATTALVDQVSVTDNRVRAENGSAAVGISVELNSDTRTNTRSKVRGNIVEDYAYAFDIKKHGFSDVIENHATGTTDFLLTSDMTNTPPEPGQLQQRDGCSRNGAGDLTETSVATARGEVGEPSGVENSSGLDGRAVPRRGGCR